MDPATRQTVTQLRHSGQYEAALGVLAHTVDQVDDGWVLCERAMCHFMRHQFEEVARDCAQLAARETSRGSIEEAIVLTLYDLSRVHTDLALQEAVQTAQDTYARWLAHKLPESFQDQDLSLLCYCHTTLGLGCRFLCGSTQEVGSLVADLPSRSLLDVLRARFLRERQLGSLAMVHLAEAGSEPPDTQIIRVRQTLELVPPADDDLRLHLGVLLARAYHEKGDNRELVQELMRAGSSPCSGRSPEAQWWTEYYLLRAGEHEKAGLDVVEDLLRACIDHGARDAALVSGFLEAELHLDRGDENGYSERIRVLAERRWASPVVLPPTLLCVVRLPDTAVATSNSCLPGRREEEEEGGESRHTP